MKLNDCCLQVEKRTLETEQNAAQRTTESYRNTSRRRRRKEFPFLSCDGVETWGIVNETAIPPLFLNCLKKRERANAMQHAT